MAHSGESPMNEDRMVEIEIKVARQEELVEALNQIVYRQQKKIDELEALCAALARRIKELQGIDTERSPAHEKPPHY
jgi:SlyX protein